MGIVAGGGIMRAVIAYDISDNKKRSKVIKELKAWGYREELSVFECELPAKEMNKLALKIGVIIEEGDRCHIYSLCAECTAKQIIIGKSIEPKLTEINIF